MTLAPDLTGSHHLDQQELKIAPRAAGGIEGAAVRDARIRTSGLIYLLRRTRAAFAWLLTRLIAKFLPERHWYQAARWLVPVQGFIEGLTGRARMELLDHWMERLTHSGKPFPIPWKVVGLDALPAAGEIEHGVLYCSGHIPMFRVGLAALIKLGRYPTAAVADRDTFPAGSEMLPVWGLTERISRIPTGSYALVQARTVLKKGGSVIALTDLEAGGNHSPNVFHLARRLGTEIVCLFTEVQRDGSILVIFKRPPYPVCTSDESVEADITWLKAELSQLAARII